MRVPPALVGLGLASQVPLQPSLNSSTMAAPGFAFQQGPDLFSPIDLVQLPRPGAGVANPAGDLVFVPVSQYSLKDKKVSKSIHIAAVEGEAVPLDFPLATGGEAFWLDDRTLAHAVTEGKDKDKTIALYALSVKVETPGSILPDSPVLIGSFPTDSATNFRYAPGAGVLVFSDYVHADGDLKKAKEHDAAWENRGDTAFVYDETFERHWDTWVGPKTTSLFSVKLAKGKDGKWTIGTEFTNLLQGSGLHCPVEPFGGTDDFDISDSSVIFTAKDPQLPKAWHTKQNVYLVPLDGSAAPHEITAGKFGATHAPVFNTAGDMAAWTQLDRDGHESDRAKLVLYDIKKDVRFTITQGWDRSVGSIAFARDDKTIFVTAGDHARIKIFSLPVPPTPSASTATPSLSAEFSAPRALTTAGAASAVQPLPNGRLLLTRSSLTSPNDVFVLRGLDSAGAPAVDQLTRFAAPAMKGKALAEGEDFWFTGAEGRKVHGWKIKPPGFKEGEAKKWPILLLIHGGPEGAWEDQWSNRWNPNIFAQQGYYVIAINPTGSTSFGQELTDAIAEDWGGKPFVDLQAGWKYILDTVPEVDPERAWLLARATAVTLSMRCSWIQGHPEFGFNFKALVCHDGAFGAQYHGYSTDELFFFNYEWGGRPWEARAKEVIAKYDPINFVDKWSTPMLIIHGSKDYRLPETDGIGAFHALQQLGVPSRLVIFPDENHWVLNHQNSIKWHYEVFRWLAQYSGKSE
ncbi:alpha/beta-hydrolase [Epithele typhae]|uniref:alpha/beta-hydrolase n=1 Tax=Epithele typhae TaxID=378194 RepID=UPI00200832E4|nr:alpha/beta-hydrolase [Epithele typhae]KAH9932677.1 alpha/beta-hydrolase [Epithele typhae]